MPRSTRAKPPEPYVQTWCPAEWRDDYRRWVGQGMKRSEAKRIILDHIAVRGVSA